MIFVKANIFRLCFFEVSICKHCMHSVSASGVPKVPTRALALDPTRDLPPTHEPYCIPTCSKFMTRKAESCQPKTGCLFGVLVKVFVPY